MATFAIAGVLSVSALSATSAAPVPGYEALYAQLITSCSLPDEDAKVAACEAAINTYSGALVVGTEISVANQSFTEARLEVFALNASDDEFQAEIDALFELLLPDSGAIAAEDDDGPPAANDGSGTLPPVPSPN
jgi:hypothetical protein